MFKFLSNLFGKADADTLLASDEEFPGVVAARFHRVIETEGAIYGTDGHDWDAVSVERTPIESTCVGVTRDWDAGVDIDCPDHRGTFCPGVTTTYR